MAKVGPSVEGLVLAAVLDVRLRHLRLIHGIRQLARDDDPAVRGLVRASERKALDGLEAFEIPLRDLVELTPSGGALSGDPDLAMQWTDMARQRFTTLRALQTELLKYLPISARVPADIGFFLSRGVDLSPTRASHRERFALVSSLYSTWESEPFVDSGAPVAALPVPFGERLTPMRWPHLLHELGHHILPATPQQRREGEDDTESVIAAVLGSSPAAEQRSNYREVLADRVAERYCGPSYAFALALETVLSEGISQNESPSVYRRLSVLDAWPQLQHVIPPSWRASLERGNNEADLSAARDEALKRMPAEEHLMPRSPIVDEVVRLMRRSEPSGSVRLDPELVGNGPSADAEEGCVDDRFLRAADIVVRDSEILTAAWTLACCRAADDYLEALSTPYLHDEGLDLKAVNGGISALSVLDTGMSRSLQSIGVHQWLIANDDEIAVATSPIYEALKPALAPLQTMCLPNVSSGQDGNADSELGNESSPLSDTQLLARLTTKGQGALVIRPLVDPNQVGGTTIDLRLGTEWEVLRTSRFRALDPSESRESVAALLDASVEQFRLTTGQNQGLVLHPGELILALTLEYLNIPDDLWGNVEGRSTWGRLGLQVHATAGMVDAGFSGYLTLELQNTARLPMVLTPGLRVAQLAFFPVHNVARPYRSKTGAAYSDQTTARTAFAVQHEHEALRRYVQAEQNEYALDMEARSRKAPDTPS